MRPLKLVMRAFGPYKGAETVDFAELEGHKLFLIHGETGAGKTSILDAIVFALYGDTSGGERKAQQMRCESADPATPTEVAFDFALGPRTYRVVRRPAQDLARTRGEGTVSKPASAALWETTEAAPGDEGELLGSQIGKVNDKVGELLGFSSEQFRQVVVLPQGKFRDLLAAGSDKREEILRQLFSTRECAGLERRLKELARDVVRQSQDLRLMKRTRLETVSAEDEGQLEALTRESEEAVHARAEEAARVAKEAEAAAAALAEALRADEAARAVVAARARVEALTAEQPRSDALEATARRARRAQRVEPLVAAERLAAARAESTAAAEGEAHQRLAEAAEREARAVEVLAEQQAREPERAAALEEVRRLDAMRSAVVAWRQAAQLRLQAETSCSVAAADLAAAEAAVIAARTACEEAEARLAAADAARAGLEAARQRREQAAQLAALCEARDAAAAEVARAQRARGAAAARDEAARAACEMRRGEYAAAEESWRGGRAAALAAGLTDGEPCPVCGSTAHPAPAPPAEGADDGVLAAARERLEEAQGQLEACSQALSVADNDLASARGELKALEGQLSDGATTQQAREAVRACEGECAALDGQVAQVAEPEALRAAVGAALEAAEGRLAAARAAERSAADDLAETRARAEQLAAGIPDELRDEAALERAAGDATARAARLAAELKAADDEHGAAREQRVAAERDLEASARAAATAAQDVAACLAAVDSALQAHGFDSRESFSAAVMADGAIAEAEAAVARHAEQLGEARGQLAQASAAAAEHPVSGEPAGLSELHERAAAAAREAQGLQTQAEARLAQLHEARAALDGLARDEREVEARYRVVGRLSDVANGQAGGAKVSFQRWVLGKYLDIVLVAASERLRAMSRERYELHRQREASDFQRASGLDLAVADSWSNRSRPAVTLSGGESFLAALSLALGLAETVEAQSGGVRLETIFVDEGFGALDPESLDLAMDALVQLRDTGRLVGVISHVPELQHVIAARLEVKGGPGGSRTSFHVP